VPLRGQQGKEAPFGRTGGKGFGVRGAESQRALGRKSLAENIIGASAMQYAEAAIRGEKNKVDQTFLRFVRAHPSPDVWEIVEKPPTKRYYDKQQGKVVEREDYGWLQRPENENVLQLKEDGKPVFVRIKDEALARAMTGMGSEQVNAVVRGLSMVNRYLSLINTAYVPEFVLSNFVRDLQTAMFNASVLTDISKEQARGLGQEILKGAVPAIAGAWKGEHEGKGPTADYYREYKASGGRIGFFSMKDAEQTQKNFIQSLQLLRPDKVSSVYRYARAAGRYVSEINSAIENATRLSTYIALRKRGVSKKQSAFIARNITVDFNLKGEWGGVINALWIFSNASIQGGSRLLTAMKSPKARIMATGIVALSVVSAILGRYMGGRDPDDEKDRIDKIPNNVKERNIIIMGVGKQGQHVKIPIPYGYNVFWALGQAIESAMHGKEGITRGAALVGGAIMNAFNPLGGASGSLLQNIMPTAGRLPLDLALNKDWMAGPIMPEEKYGPARAKAFRHTRGTSAASRVATEAASRLTGGREYQPGLVDISPDQLDYVFGYATGGAGRTAMSPLNLAMKAFTKEPIAAREIPFVRRVYGELYEGVDIQAFDDAVNKVESSRAQLKFLRENQPNKAKAYKARNRALLSDATNDLTNNSINRIRALRKQAQKLRAEGKTAEAREVDKKIALRARFYVGRLNRRLKNKPVAETPPPEAAPPQ
jgi:predicted transcriptional regulator